MSDCGTGKGAQVGVPKLELGTGFRGLGFRVSGLVFGT